jgi:hypothetical protein
MTSVQREVLSPGCVDCLPAALSRCLFWSLNPALAPSMVVRNFIRALPGMISIKHYKSTNYRSMSSVSWSVKFTKHPVQTFALSNQVEKTRGTTSGYPRETGLRHISCSQILMPACQSIAWQARIAINSHAGRKQRRINNVLRRVVWKWPVYRQKA